jgi:hypothetical protein
MENELSIYDGKPNRKELAFRDTALWTRNVSPGGGPTLAHVSK